MYLNKGKLNIAMGNTRLTVTLDVFKSSNQHPINIFLIWLTVTLDVFK